MPRPETSVILRLLAEVRLIPGALPAKPHTPKVYPPPPQPTTSLQLLMGTLRSPWFTSLAGYYINHRPSSQYASLNDETKIQDLLYTMATAFIPDLHFEDPQDKTKGAVTSTRVDFTSDSSRLFFEAKLATATHDAKKVEAEISEDIVKYGKHGTFDTLVFFVYCHQYSFPNGAEFEKGHTSQHTISGHTFDTVCIVKP